MTEEEALIYVSMKDIMVTVKKKFLQAKSDKETALMRKFASHLLVLLQMLRQIVVSPILPIAKAYLDITDLTCNHGLAKTITDKINVLGLQQWMESTESVRSSRIKKVIEVINNHTSDRIILFTSFRKNLNIIDYYIKLDTGRPTFTLSSTMSAHVRGKTIMAFENTENGILELTYGLGCNGLNLQKSNIMLLCDFWWNHATTQQAITRIVRQGQLADTVYIYYLTSNTGVEQAVFFKQSDKLSVISELKNGPSTTKMRNINVSAIVKFIDDADNSTLLETIRNKC